MHLSLSVSGSKTQIFKLTFLLGMFVYLPFASFRAIWIYSIQGILLVIFAWAVPYMNVGSIALLNKFSPSDHQSKLQGMRSSLGRLAKGKLS